MPPKSQVEKIIADLQQLAQALGGVSDIEEATENARADLNSLNKTLAQANAQAAESQGLYTKSQAELQRKFDQDMYNKQSALKGLQERVSALEARDRELTNEVAVKSAQLASIEQGFAEARRRLAG
jgi:chromosome segregation ATPase